MRSISAWTRSLNGLSLWLDLWSSEVDPLPLIRQMQVMLRTWYAVLIDDGRPGRTKGSLQTVQRRTAAEQRDQQAQCTAAQEVELIRSARFRALESGRGPWNEA